MLPDSRIAGFSCNFRFARPRWLFSLGMGFVSNIRRNMLFYSILQSLGSASYVARITLARNFIYNGTFVCGRNALLLNGRKYLYYDVLTSEECQTKSFSLLNVCFFQSHFQILYHQKIVNKRK